MLAVSNGPTITDHRRQLHVLLLQRGGPAARRTRSVRRLSPARGGRERDLHRGQRVHLEQRLVHGHKRLCDPQVERPRYRADRGHRLPQPRLTAPGRGRTPRSPPRTWTRMSERATSSGPTTSCSTGSTFAGSSNPGGTPSISGEPQRHGSVDHGGAAPRTGPGDPESRARPARRPPLRGDDRQGSRRQRLALDRPQHPHELERRRVRQRRPRRLPLVSDRQPGLVAEPDPVRDSVFDTTPPQSSRTSTGCPRSR